MQELAIKRFEKDVESVYHAYRLSGSERAKFFFCHPNSPSFAIVQRMRLTIAAKKGMTVEQCFPQEQSHEEKVNASPIGSNPKSSSQSEASAAGSLEDDEEIFLGSMEGPRKKFYRTLEDVFGEVRSVSRNGTILPGTKSIWT